MAFSYEKIQIREQEGLEITSYSGTAKRLVVPDEIDGIPVISIGRMAFTRQEELRELILPESLLMLKPFSLSHCRNLNKVVLYDGVTDYYDSAMRTLTGLRLVELHMKQERYDAIRDILDDSDRKVCMLMHFPEFDLRMTFPAYLNDTIEDTRASTFHVKITGSGFAFRECIRRDGIKYKEYDGLFRRVVSDETDAAIKIAVDRLEYPVKLSEDAANVYRKFLKTEMERALQLAVEPENEDWIELLIKEDLIEEEMLDLALRLVSEKRLTAFAGMLMDYRAGKQKPAQSKVLALDDDFDLF